MAEGRRRQDLGSKDHRGHAPGQDNVWEQGAGTIDKIRGELGKKLGGEVKLNSFLRFGLGEGIEKKVENLAHEVAKTIGA